MTDVNIENLNSAQLAQLEADIEKRKKKLEKERVSIAAKEIKAVLDAHTVEIDEVLPYLEKRGGGNMPKSPAKYRNPADSSQTWTGRGRKPNWVIAALDAGKTLDDMAI
ncbi:DNA binding protein, nucleoid-associated [Aquimixticola soesokkakensis]|uniref:DNA binding protein, nucleoid-associated n=1 Tax=Aquimixticola soesokkakensis TaxID=1519096 RepID=A0A1Y5RDW0_9RHOB|nr:H-NS histone family protein [Aquimixticola soesokkakensis]SLN15163.1 DNA binding protein, nucleoid-associated [Aquimixticola soesokkakensis]